MKRPHRFEIEIDQAFAPRIVYRIETGGAVTLHRANLEHRKSMPTLIQWASFWRLCDFLDLWNWRPHYDEEHARDGQEWKIRVAYSKSKQIESGGLNTYPSLDDCQVGRATADRFGLLLTFIDLTLFNPRVDWRDCFADESDAKRPL